jgi:hypothetical protein
MLDSTRREDFSPSSSLLAGVFLVLGGEASCKSPFGNEANTYFVLIARFTVM